MIAVDYAGVGWGFCCAGERKCARALCVLGGARSLLHVISFVAHNAAIPHLVQLGLFLTTSADVLRSAGPSAQIGSHGYICMDSVSSSSPISFCREALLCCVWCL